MNKVAAAGLGHGIAEQRLIELCRDSHGNAPKRPPPMKAVTKKGDLVERG